MSRTAETFPGGESRALDPTRVAAFAERGIGILNDAGLAILISIGHQTGLFDALAKMPPSTTVEIARAANLNERYVREWLGGMVAGRIVEYDRNTRRYSLPAEHAASLTSAAGPDNLATFMQYIALMAEVEQGIVNCFRRGGGLPYSAYPRLQRIQAAESRQIHDASLLQRTLPLDPELLKRLRKGIDVADVGCGSGHALNLMAREFPDSRFSGFDISTEGIAAARAEAREWGLSNVRFEIRDVAELGVTAEFDFITAFDTIHDQANPRQVLKGVARAIRPDGLFLMIDIAASSEVADNIDNPLGPILYVFSVMHCMTVSLAEGGEGLGTVWGEQKARELLSEAGFREVDVRRVDGDILNAYYFVRK